MNINKMKEYDISVIIPTYNCREYLPTALKSVLEQDIGHEKIQIIVVDDGSTDGTDIVMQSYLQQFPNNIFYYKKPNGNWGSVVNFVKHRKLATGKLITILDSDDFFYPHAFGKVMLHAHEDMVVSSFDCINYDKSYELNPFFGKSRIISNKKKLRTPHSQPLSKFYSNELFYNLDDLVENMWYQDCILYHNAISKVKSVYYIRESLATWYSSRPGNSTTTPWSNEAKFNAWCDTLKGMCSNGAGVVVYIYSLLPGFIDALKERNMTIELPCRPSYTWLPPVIAPLFGKILHFKIRHWVKYPKKKQTLLSNLAWNAK